MDSAKGLRSVVMITTFAPLIPAIQPLDCVNTLPSIVMMEMLTLMITVTLWLDAFSCTNQPLPLDWGWSKCLTFSLLLIKMYENSVIAHTHLIVPVHEISNFIDIVLNHKCSTHWNFWALLPGITRLCAFVNLLYVNFSLDLCFPVISFKKYWSLRWCNSRTEGSNCWEDSCTLEIYCWEYIIQYYRFCNSDERSNNWILRVIETQSTKQKLG